MPLYSLPLAVYLFSQLPAQPLPASPSLPLLERTVLVLALGAWTASLLYKIQAQQLLSILYPCHFALLTLAAILLLPDRSWWKARLRLGLNAMVYGVLLAFMVPDLTGLDSAGIGVYYL